MVTDCDALTMLLLWLALAGLLMGEAGNGRLENGERNRESDKIEDKKGKVKKKGRGGSSSIKSIIRMEKR